MMRMKSAGFSLLEVLITILLITVGVLGMVGMQGKAIQYTQDSVERTYAASLAYELLDIIRATPGELDKENSPYLFDSLPASVTGTCFDLDEASLNQQVGCWASRARTLLPGADSLSEHFTSCFSTEPGVCSGDGAALEIRLAWDASGEGCLDADSNELADSLCTFTFRSQI